MNADVKALIKTLFKGVLYGVLTAFILLGVKFYWYTEVKGFTLTMPPGGRGEVLHKVNVYTVTGANMREKIACEFDEPLKHLTLINHWYDSNAEMYADYIVLTKEQDQQEEIWGWSNCVWQPDDDWAACDVYLVKPEFVHADMYIDTFGHEAMHGACGNFHD